jgi:VanZ family protein
VLPAGQPPLESSVTLRNSRLFPFWKAIGLLLVLLVCVASLVPTLPELPGSPSDKLEHSVAYATLVFWWGMLYPRSRERWLACALFIGMGVALEFAQGATDYRVFDVLDIAANATGAVIGRVLVATPFGRILEALDRRLAPVRRTHV